MVANELNRVAAALGRTRVRRPFVVVIVYLALLRLLVLGSILLGHVAGELTRFVNRIPDAVDSLDHQLGRLGLGSRGSSATFRRS